MRALALLIFVCCRPESSVETHTARAHNYLVKNGITQSDVHIFEGKLLTAAQKSSFSLLWKAVTSGNTTSPAEPGFNHAVIPSSKFFTAGRVMASGNQARERRVRGEASKPGTASGPRGAPAAFPSQRRCRGRSSAAMRRQQRRAPRARAAGGQDGGSHGAELLGR